MQRLELQAFGVNKQQRSDGTDRDFLGDWWLEAWEWCKLDTHTHAHWPCTQSYKLEGVVVVDPQITVMAAVTQKEVGQANTEGSRKKTNPWLLRTRNIHTEIKKHKNASADDHNVVTDAPQEANSRLVRFGSSSFYFKVLSSVKPALLQLVDCEDFTLLMHLHLQHGLIG